MSSGRAVAVGVGEGTGVAVAVSQLPVSVETVPRVKPTGQVSDRLTLSALEGPLLVTTMSY